VLATPSVTDVRTYERRYGHLTAFKDLWCGAVAQ